MVFGSKSPSALDAHKNFLTEAFAEYPGHMFLRLIK